MPLGPGGSIQVVEDAIITVHHDLNADGKQWDLSTETSTSIGPRERGDPVEHQGSYALSRNHSSWDEMIFTVGPGTGPPRTYAGAGAVEFGAPGELVFATSPWGGFSNLFTMDIETGATTFVATAEVRLDAIGIAANERWVVWTTDFCGSFVSPGPEGRGSTRVLDRSTGTIYDLGKGHWPAGFTPDGRLGTGSIFGATSLVDLDAWSYDVVLPGGSGDVHWSPDYRYATRGATGGHGGVCSF